MNVFHHDEDVRRTQIALVEGLREWGPWDFAATWAFNRPTPLGSAANWLRRFDARVSRCLYGKRHFRRDLHRRVQFVALPACVAHMHYHGVVRVPDDRRPLFREVAVSVWADLIPGGSLNVKDIHDPDGWIRYITHNRGGWALLEEYVHSAMFAPCQRAA